MGCPKSKKDGRILVSGKMTFMETEDFNCYRVPIHSNVLDSANFRIPLLYVKILPTYSDGIKSFIIKANFLIMWTIKKHAVPLHLAYLHVLLFFVSYFRFQTWLNMELDLKSLFRLHVTRCAQLYSLAETRQPPHPLAFGLAYTGALLVSHLFVTRWFQKMCFKAPDWAVIGWRRPGDGEGADLLHPSLQEQSRLYE
jgi:hypothetical protein